LEPTAAELALLEAQRQQMVDQQNVLQQDKASLDKVLEIIARQLDDIKQLMESVNFIVNSGYDVPNDNNGHLERDLLAQQETKLTELQSIAARLERIELDIGDMDQTIQSFKDAISKKGLIGYGTNDPDTIEALKLIAIYESSTDVKTSAAGSVPKVAKTPATESDTDEALELIAVAKLAAELDTEELVHHSAAGDIGSTDGCIIC